MRVQLAAVAVALAMSVIAVGCGDDAMGGPEPEPDAGTAAASTLDRWRQRRRRRGGDGAGDRDGAARWHGDGGTHWRRRATAATAATAGDGGDGRGMLSGRTGARVPRKRGQSGAAAPFHGANTTANRAVGAHQSHLGPSTWHHEVQCTECHVVPTTTSTDPAFPLHLNGVRDIVWGPLAKSGVYSEMTTTCTGTYCHGATLKGDLAGVVSNRTPKWTTVDGSQKACGTSCHTLPPGGGHTTSTGVSDAATRDRGLHARQSAGGGRGRTRRCTSTARSTCGARSRARAATATVATNNPMPPLGTKGETTTAEQAVGAHAKHVGVVDVASRRAMQRLPRAARVDGPRQRRHRLRVGRGEHRQAAPRRRYTPATATCADVYCHGSKLLGAQRGRRGLAEPRVERRQRQLRRVRQHLPHQPAGRTSTRSDRLRELPWRGDRHLRSRDQGRDVERPHAARERQGRGQGRLRRLPRGTADDGAHLAHYGDLQKPPVATYGDLRVVTDYAPGGSSKYIFGCGHCHPTDEARHGDGVLDVDLSPAGAPASSLKAKNAPTASYAGGACSGVYCHSSGQQTPTYVASPPWSGTFAGPRCAGCHTNPPAYPSGGAGTATANSHLVLADDGYELGHFGGMPGPWHTSYHGAPELRRSRARRATTSRSIQATSALAASTISTPRAVRPGRDLNYCCDKCHTGVAGAPAVKAASATATHVNGVREVDFDPRTAIPAAVTGLPLGSTARVSVLGGRCALFLAARLGPERHDLVAAPQRVHLRSGDEDLQLRPMPLEAVLRRRFAGFVRCAGRPPVAQRPATCATSSDTELSASARSARYGLKRRRPGVPG